MKLMKSINYADFPHHQTTCARLVNYEHFKNFMSKNMLNVIWNTISGYLIMEKDISCVIGKLKIVFVKKYVKYDMKYDK